MSKFDSLRGNRKWYKIIFFSFFLLTTDIFCLSQLILSFDHESKSNIRNFRNILFRQCNLYLPFTKAPIIVATNITSSKMKLNWNSINGVAYYAVEIFPTTKQIPSEIQASMKILTLILIRNKNILLMIKKLLAWFDVLFNYICSTNNSHIPCAIK